VEVSIAVEGHQAVLRVRDYGVGISPEALPRIFERSYRAPEAAAYAPGLGLGLSIAAQVVAPPGGTIGAAAADGSGTIVSVRLPLAPQHRPAEQVDAVTRNRARVSHP
jgi:two-component system sensor histidine kinase MprB